MNYAGFTLEKGRLVRKKIEDSCNRYSAEVVINNEKLNTICKSLANLIIEQFEDFKYTQTLFKYNSDVELIYNNLLSAMSVGSVIVYIKTASDITPNLETRRNLDFIFRRISNHIFKEASSDDYRESYVDNAVDVTLHYLSKNTSNNVIDISEQISLSYYNKTAHLFLDSSSYVKRQYFLMISENVESCLDRILYSGIT